MTLSGMDYISMIRELYEKNLLPAKIKKKENNVLKNLKRRLF